VANPITIFVSYPIVRHLIIKVDFTHVQFIHDLVECENTLKTWYVGYVRREINVSVFS